MHVLRLTDTKVPYAMAIVPSSRPDVDAATGLHSAGQYNEANETVKQVQDSARDDQVDLKASPESGNLVSRNPDSGAAARAIAK